MGPLDAMTSPRPEVAAPQLDLPGARSGAGTTRWAVFAALTILAISYSAYSLAALGYTTLTGDTGAQYYLAKITSEGAVPLVDFQHGWNTGSWWASAVLYRIAGGDPTLWWFLWGRLLGVGLAAVLVAAIGLRLRLAPSAMITMALGVLILVPPAHMKYALPVVWAFVLLPSNWRDRGRGRLVVCFLAPFVLFWLHVELAILLTAGTVLFELVGRRDAPWASRLLRSVALGTGLVIGFVSEVLFYRVGYGMSVAEFNRQVVFGQAQEFPKHFGWPFFDVPTIADNYMVVALFPVAVLLAFVPAIWRQLADPTRFAALCALCLATIAIRRTGPGHSTTIGALVLVALVLVVCDLEFRRTAVTASAPRRPRPRPLTILVGGVGGLVGVAWALLALKVGFGTDSLAGPVVLILLAVAAVLATRFFAPRLLGASLGALLVIAGYPVAAAVDRVHDVVREDEPLAMAQQMSTAIKPELTRCLGGSNEALIIPTVLPLYDELGVQNPTPFYLFHYDFGRNQKQVEADFKSGRVPVVIAATALPNHPWMKASLHENYRRCSRVNIEQHGEIVDIWTHISREPFDKRVVTVKPNGEITATRR